MLLVKKSGSKITPTFTVISKRKLVAHQKFTGRKIYLLLILYKTSIQPLNNNQKFVFKSNYGTETPFKHKKTIGFTDGFLCFILFFQNFTNYTVLSIFCCTFADLFAGFTDELNTGFSSTSSDFPFEIKA